MGNGWYPDMCPLSKKIQPGGTSGQGGRGEQPHRAPSRCEPEEPIVPPGTPEVGAEGSVIGRGDTFLCGRGRRYLDPVTM